MERRKNNLIRLAVTVGFAALIGGLTKAAAVVGLLELEASTAAFVTAILTATIQLVQALERRFLSAWLDAGVVTLGDMFDTLDAQVLDEEADFMGPGSKGAVAATDLAENPDALKRPSPPASGDDEPPPGRSA